MGALKDYFTFYGVRFFIFLIIQVSYNFGSIKLYVLIFSYLNTPPPIDIIKTYSALKLRLEFPS